MKRLLLALTLAAPLPVTQAKQPVADPWPNSPVLLRLFLLPENHAEGQRLVRVLALRPAQVRTLKDLARTEATYAQLGRQVLGREEAARLNARIAAMRVEKDRKVRALLGPKYPAFRQWVRVWWRGEVQRAR